MSVQPLRPEGLSSKSGSGQAGFKKRFLIVRRLRSYPVLMRVTLSIDDQTLVRARQVARQRGTSLNQMLRDCLQGLTADDPAQAVAEMERLWSEEEGDSHGWKWNREEAWLRAAARNPVFQDLEAPEEDIYSLGDGEPFHDQA